MTRSLRELLMETLERRQEPAPRPTAELLTPTTASRLVSGEQLGEEVLAAVDDAMAKGAPDAAAAAIAGVAAAAHVGKVAAAADARRAEQILSLQSAVIALWDVVKGKAAVRAGK
jgi:hypothetical protein